MNTEKILYEIHIHDQIVYLDSSSLIRNYPLNTLSKNLTRAKYTSNPHRFSNMLNYFINPLYETSALLYNIFDEITKCINKIKIITYDCMFPLTSNKHISTLFGSLDFFEGIASINNSIVLYDDVISVETFFNASTLIRSANLIIIDDYFLSLSVGRQLLNRKKEDTLIITLSSIIGYRAYHTEEVIDAFNSLYSKYYL